MSPRVEVHRVYDDLPPDGGTRILVDRLWPRGVAKAEAPWDEWLKEVAPSTELRQWYHHDPDRFTTFARRYRSELRRPPAADAVDQLRQLAAGGPVTLLTATRDVEHSAAHVLHQELTHH